MNKLAFVAIMATSSVALADDYYKVTVTREESNFYKVDGTDLYIQTKYCYEYSYSDKAVLLWKRKGEYAGNKLMFIGFDGKIKETCDVVALLRETEPS